MEKAGTTIMASVLLQAAFEISCDPGVKVTIGRLNNVYEPLSFVRQSPVPQS